VIGVEESAKEKENHQIEANADLRHWQVDHIKASIKQAESGQLIDHGKVKERAAKWKFRGFQRQCGQYDRP
jgi:predicted transcriptional regulator